MPPKQTLDFQSFVIEYERRHADLEQRLAVQSAEQKLRDEQVTKELQSLHAGIDDIKKTLSNGLVSKVESLEKTLGALSAQIKTDRETASARRWELLLPTIRTLMWGGIISLGVLVVVHLKEILAAFGIHI